MGLSDIFPFLHHRSLLEQIAQADAAYKQKAAENPTEQATPKQMQEAEKKRQLNETNYASVFSAQFQASQFGGSR
jgi:hypothetical protein